MSEFAKIRLQNDIQRKYYECRTLKQNKRMLPTNSNYIRRHVQKFIKFSNLNKNELILDVGCGMGKYTIPLVNAGYNVSGLDLSPYLLKELEKNINDNAKIPVYCEDLLNPIPELKEKFDVITGFFMLHHLIDIEKAFLAIHHYLKPGGKMVFLDVNPFCPLYYFQITLAPTMRWKAEKGILNITQHRLKKCAKNTGFYDFKSEFFGMLPPFLANTSFGASLEGKIEQFEFLNCINAFQLFSAVKNNK